MLYVQIQTFMVISLWVGCVCFFFSFCNITKTSKDTCHKCLMLSGYVNLIAVTLGLLQRLNDTLVALPLFVTFHYLFWRINNKDATHITTCFWVSSCKIKIVSYGWFTYKNNNRWKSNVKLYSTMWIPSTLIHEWISMIWKIIFLLISFPVTHRYLRSLNSRQSLDAYQFAYSLFCVVTEFFVSELNIIAIAKKRHFVCSTFYNLMNLKLRDKENESQ